MGASHAIARPRRSELRASSLWGPVPVNDGAQRFLSRPLDQGRPTTVRVSDETVGRDSNSNLIDVFDPVPCGRYHFNEQAAALTLPLASHHTALLPRLENARRIEPPVTTRGSNIRVDAGPAAAGRSNDDQQNKKRFLQFTLTAKAHAFNP